MSPGETPTFGRLPSLSRALGPGIRLRSRIIPSRVGVVIAIIGNRIPANHGRHLVIGNLFACFPVAPPIQKVDRKLQAAGTGIGPSTKRVPAP